MDKSNKDSPNILVIHGPNLNMLGKREVNIYGKSTLDKINVEMIKTGENAGFLVETFQSNHEGAIVDKIQQAMEKHSGLIINPAAFTHTSIAIRDALLLLEIPVIELHISNIYKREPFRQKSMMSDVTTAIIAGFGVYGYTMALEAVIRMIRSDTPHHEL